MSNLTINELRAKFIMGKPYFGSAVMNLKPVEKPIGTFAVDKYWRLYYDPAAILKWTSDECVSVLEHELMHPLRCHHERQDWRDSKLWNVAADAEINDDVPGLPKGCITPDSLKAQNGLTAEEYYDLIPKDQSGGQGQPQPHDCGSGCGGEKREWEDGDTGDGISPVEAQAIRRQTAEAIRQSGDASAGLRRWADEILTPPRIHWSKLLPAAVRLAVAQGSPQRYRYPARRESDFILPRLVSGRPSATIIIDSSGSMTDTDLALAIAITKDASRNAEVSIWACDVEATRVSRLAPGCIIGGGGTNMMNGIRAAMEAKPKPQAIVIITDCYSPWDTVGPKVPVVILTANPDQAPQWAKVVKVEQP